MSVEPKEVIDDELPQPNPSETIHTLMAASAKASPGWRRILPASLASVALHFFVLSFVVLVTVHFADRLVLIADWERPAIPELRNEPVYELDVDYKVVRIDEKAVPLPGAAETLPQHAPPQAEGPAEPVAPPSPAVTTKSAGQPKPSSRAGMAIVHPADSIPPHDRTPDVPFVPTPQAVVEEMLQLAGVGAGDLVFDLGCGDGRIPITAAKKFGALGFGYDIDPERIKEALENVKKNGVEGRVVIERRDIFKLDLSQADVVTLYLLPTLNVKLLPQLERMQAGARIVSHDFWIDGVKPAAVKDIEALDDWGNKRTHRIYLWTVPLEQEKPDLRCNIPVPPPQAVVDEMLKLAGVTNRDLVIDPNCWNGGFVVSAAKHYGAKAYGCDFLPERVKEARNNVKNNNVGNLVTIEQQQDLFNVDFSAASVATLYLLPSINVKLIPQLNQMRPGSRIVSLDFGMDTEMETVKPKAVKEIEAGEGPYQRTWKIYLWTVPLVKEKKEDG